MADFSTGCTSAPNSTSSGNTSTDVVCDEFHRDVVDGLSQDEKLLDSKYLYDQQGSALFDRICELDEYYPTRTEISIMERHAPMISDAIGHNAVVIELGSGSSLKTRILLAHLNEPTAYLPIDISKEHLLKSADALMEDFPEIQVDPVVADFTQQFSIPSEYCGHNITVFFPGSTIGNLERCEAVELLKQVARLNGGKVGLLIGFDLVKDHDVLELAYNDREGISEQFTLNLLHRINRELPAEVDVDQFEHVAVYNADERRIEIFVESKAKQTIQIGEHSFAIEDGERIRTEYSHKYTLKGFREMGAQAGLQMQHVWTDPDDYFAVAYLTSLPQNN